MGLALGRGRPLSRPSTVRRSDLWPICGSPARHRCDRRHRVPFLGRTPLSSAAVTSFPVVELAPRRLCTAPLPSVAPDAHAALAELGALLAWADLADPARTLRECWLVISPESRVVGVSAAEVDEALPSGIDVRLVPAGSYAVTTIRHADPADLERALHRLRAAGAAGIGLARIEPTGITRLFVGPLDASRPLDT